MTAKELLFACTSAHDSNDYPVCLVFMTGFGAGAVATLAQKPWCLPPNTTLDEVILAFVRVMRTHPQLLDEPLSVATGAAMVTAYPCHPEAERKGSKATPVVPKRPNAQTSQTIAPATDGGSRTVPNAESLLIVAVEKARAAYGAGANDMARGAARPARAREICAVLSNRRVANWVGAIETLSSNSDGLGVLSILIADGISIKTWNNSLSDTAFQTLIDPGSPIFKIAVTLKEGQRVAFGGEFFPDPTIARQSG